MRVVVMVGTEKGAFLYRSDDSRQQWSIEGPLFKGWKVTAAARDEAGNYLAGLSNFVYGATVHKSSDLVDWRQIDQGPAFGEDGASKLSQIWKLKAAGDLWYAGVADAGIFRSEDQGETWTPLNGLNEHESRGAWQPGYGGLCAHAILIDPENADRLWCGISSVGVFRSDDGGATWEPKNEGVPVIIPDQQFAQIGYCVHALALDPDSGRIYRQDHKGMFRTSDGGDHWERIENGLPSGFGFPITIAPRTGMLFSVPLESDEFRLPKDGRLAVYRSTDGGDSWQSASRGLPEKNAYAGVLRGAMDSDDGDPAGVYFATSSGEVYASADGGDHWTQLPGRLPRVHCVTAFVED